MSPIERLTSFAEFPTGLDLNLSLHSTSPSLDIQPEPPHSDHLDRRVVDSAKPPATSGEFEDGESQNSTLSTFTRKRTLPEEEPRPVPDEEDGENLRKKLRLSRDQSLLLEDTFKDHNTLNPRQKQALAKQLGLSARQVEVWFQNRRARTKLKQTEADCEYMKRNCESLMDRVRRLQKEVNDLRALNPAPHIYMQMPQATTLTLCPSCERVGVPTQAPGPVIPGRVVNPWTAAGQRSNTHF